MRRVPYVSLSSEMRYGFHFVPETDLTLVTVEAVSLFIFWWVDASDQVLLHAMTCITSSFHHSRKGQQSEFGWPVRTWHCSSKSLREWKIDFLSLIDPTVAQKWQEQVHVDCQRMDEEVRNLFLYYIIMPLLISVRLDMRLEMYLCKRFWYLVCSNTNATLRTSFHSDLSPKKLVFNTLHLSLTEGYRPP